MKTERPPILYGAALIAALSLAWSGYAIADLMHSGKFGLSVALAGDVGWITVLWAEYKGVTLHDRRWAAPAAGWAIALGVAVLLVIHGAEAGGRAQAIAGPFVVVVGKTVWTFALAAMKDPTALTPQQEAEIHGVMRDSEYTARLHRASVDRIERDADAEIARIKAEARTILARDETDFQIGLERLDKQAEIHRRSPAALRPAPVPSIEPRVVAAPQPAAKPRKRQPPSDPAGPDGEVVEDVQTLFGKPHAPVVYFLRNGNRVKIGTSQNLRRRVASLSLRREDVVRVEHGDQQYERSLHRRFAELRAGNTEWFELRGALAQYLGEPEAQADEPVKPEAQAVAEPPAQPVEPQAPQLPLVLTSSQAAAPEPQDQPVEPEVRSFGFSAHLTAQSAQRAQAVAQVAELLAQDSGLTSGQVAEALSVSPATAKRYLREARQGGRA